MITLHTDIKKVNKAEAFAMVRYAMEHNEPIQGDALECLYKHFAPAIPKNVKEPWQWAAKAVAKKDVREVLNYLYSDGSRLIGCDGHRLHVIPSDLPKGYYDTKTCDPVDHDSVYPDIDRVIPADLMGPYHLENYQTVEVLDGNPCVDIDGMYFNQKYVNDGVAFTDTWAISKSIDGGRVYASNDDGYQFVIMGVRDKARKAA